MHVIIGIDPHQSSHTAVAIDTTEQVLDQLRLVAGRRQLDNCWPSPSGGPTAVGRSRAPQVWDVWLLSNWSARVSR